MTEDDVQKGEGYEWEGSSDLTSASEDELRALLKQLAEEEREISYRRRVIQGRIDLIRAELVVRGGVTLSAEELVRVLMGQEGQRPEGEPGGAPPAAGGGG